MAPGGAGGVSQTVTFTTDDGVVLGGHLFGTGSKGVILAHMYPADQTSWYATAEKLAAQGYLVLTFDFRGYGESEGDKQIDRIDRDVMAAANEIARCRRHRGGSRRSIDGRHRLSGSELGDDLRFHDLLAMPPSLLTSPRSAW